MRAIIDVGSNLGRKDAWKFERFFSGNFWISDGSCDKISNRFASFHWRFDGFGICIVSFNYLSSE
jgi:hypothetical protein